ncbi:hypothetical protein KZ810_15760 [Sphingomonas sp. RHCKR47]|uniref:hypothetical protein n=1 Tax=Sphingomonas citricola TaxID=2862498 RepID=UPI001CA5E1C7|nr:hypothetical protein [Sphingomonas citricola]MBW6524954.1 hypothetical protein [Sphingomonas citricola]
MRVLAHVRQPLCRAQQRDERLEEHEFGSAPRCGDPDVPARRVGVAFRPRQREEAVAAVDPRRREDARVGAVEQAHDLVARAAHGGGRGDDLGAHALPADVPRRERVDRGLVQTRDRAERPRDQVQFVLDDEVGRREPVSPV